MAATPGRTQDLRRQSQTPLKAAGGITPPTCASASARKDVRSVARAKAPSLPKPTRGSGAPSNRKLSPRWLSHPPQLSTIMTSPRAMRFDIPARLPFTASSGGGARRKHGGARQADALPLVLAPFGLGTSRPQARAGAPCPARPNSHTLVMPGAPPSTRRCRQNHERTTQSRVAPL